MAIIHSGSDGVRLEHGKFARRCLTFIWQLAWEVICLALNGHPILQILNLNDWKVESTELWRNGMGELQCDVLISIGIKGCVASAPRVMFLFEHKSSPDPNVIYQVSAYRHAISLKYPKSIIVSIIVYHGQQIGWNLDEIILPALELVPVELRKNVGEWSMEYPYRYLNFGDDETQRQIQNLNFRGFYDILVRSWKLTRADVGEILVSFLKLEREQRKQICEYAMVYISPLFSREETCEIEAEYIPQEDRIMPRLLTVQEEFFEQGANQGVEQGIQQGVDQNMQTVAERMIKGGYDAIEIVKISGLSLDAVSELQHKLNGAGPNGA